jgi:hypothetical protein
MSEPQLRWWIRALARLLPAGYRHEVLTDLLDERRSAPGPPGSVWVPSHEDSPIRAPVERLSRKIENHMLLSLNCSSYELPQDSLDAPHVAR